MSMGFKKVVAQPVNVVTASLLQVVTLNDYNVTTLLITILTCTSSAAQHYSIKYVQIGEMMSGRTFVLVRESALLIFWAFLLRGSYVRNYGDRSNSPGSLFKLRHFIVAST